jgi:TrmH family RNA methyltransferase
VAGHGGIVALELQGTPLGDFPFPPRGVLLVGSEELGLGPEALALADAGRVSIPTSGAKRSLNVAVACGIVLQAWAARLRALQA